MAQALSDSYGSAASQLFAQPLRHPKVC